MIKGIIGSGAFAREVYWSLGQEDRDSCVLFVDDKAYDGQQKNHLPFSAFDAGRYEVVVAIADARIRERIVGELPTGTRFFTHVDRSVIIQGDDVEIGEGSIVCAGAILTTNTRIGRHAHLNLKTTIAHDNLIGDFFTTAPGVSVSGGCVIGDRVYFGTNSCTRQKVRICDDVTVGLNAGVVGDIAVPGTYIGTPAKLMVKKN